MPPTSDSQTKIVGNRYFDPKTPEIPADILGIPTDPLLNLSKALGQIASLSSGKLPYSVSSPMYKASFHTGQALSLFPLLEQFQSGAEITAEDIRPYRKPIKGLVGGKLYAADKLAAMATVIGVGIPARRYLNRELEKGVPKKVPPLLEQANAYLPEAEPYVALVEQFENPREQFVSEVAVIADSIRRVARKRAAQDRRRYITATDAGQGIEQTLRNMVLDRGESKKELPMLFRLLIEKMPKKVKLPHADVLGVIAPEVMRALEAALPAQHRDLEFLSNIVQYPHPNRGLATLFKRRQLEGLQRLAPILLPSIRDILPTSGQEVKNIYQRIKDFLKPKN